MKLHYLAIYTGSGQDATSIPQESAYVRYSTHLSFTNQWIAECKYKKMLFNNL